MLNLIGVQFEQDVWVTQNVRLDHPMVGMKTFERHVTPEGKPVIQTHENRLVKIHSKDDYYVLGEKHVKDLIEKGVMLREIIAVTHDQLCAEDVRNFAFRPDVNLDSKKIIDYLVEKHGKRMRCFACGVEKNLQALEVAESERLCDSPIKPLFAIECEAKDGFSSDPWKAVVVCLQCFDKLRPDMWINEECWKAMNPRIPFDFLPDAVEGPEKFEAETYRIEEGPMRLCEGQIVRVKGMDVKVKEYIDRGLYQGTDVETGDLIHFVMDQITPWMIEQKLMGGWADAEWTENEKPRRFDTEAEANEAIDEFIQDSIMAAGEGALDEPYSRDVFRAVFAEV
jgi:hypothetical protein